MRMIVREAKHGGAANDGENTEQNKVVDRITNGDENEARVAKAFAECDGVKFRCDPAGNGQSARCFQRPLDGLPKALSEGCCSSC